MNRTRMRRIFTDKRLLAALFFTWLAGLLVLTYWPNMPEVEIKEEWFRTDYVGHFVFYALLIVLFLLWQHVRTGPSPPQIVLVAALAGIGLGAVTEVSQLFIPGRSLNPVDLLFNCLGIVAGALAYSAFRKFRTVRR